jgi:hypothetical protein
MSVKELSKTMARAISETLGASMNAKAIERDLAKAVGIDGVDSFDVKGYVDAFLAHNHIEPGKQLQFRVRWLPVLQLMADRTLKKVSSDRLQLFETAVGRALGTASGTITGEFNSAWDSFSKSPGDRNAYLHVMAELKKHGVGNALLSRLNGAWMNLFVIEGLGSSIGVKDARAVSAVTARASSSARPAVHYEAIDKQARTFYVRRPAPPDAAGVSLAGYRISELRAAHHNVMMSPVSIVSAYPGFNVGSSFGPVLTRGLLNSGFMVNTQDFSHPNIAEIRRFDSESAGKKRVIIFKVTGGASIPYNGYTLEFLRDRFLKGAAGDRGVSRVLFLVDSRGATPISAANSLGPYLRQVLNKSTDVPTIGINPKELNEKQIGELLYGEGVWSGGNANAVAGIVSTIKRHLPMIPAALTPLRSKIDGLRNREDIRNAILGYGEVVRAPRPVDTSKLLLTSMLPTDDSKWYRERLHNIEGSYAVRNASARDEAFESLDIHVAAADGSSNGSGSIQGGGGSVGNGESQVRSSRNAQTLRDARGWKGFYDVPDDQLAPPPGIPPMLAEELDRLFDPNAIVKTTLPGAFPIPLGSPPIGSSKPVAR